MKEEAVADANVAVETATGDMTTTVPGKRRHAFFVTPEGAAAATTPKYAPIVESPRISDELEGTRSRGSLGLVLFVLGVAVTIGTCAMSSAMGGRFLIATGPIVAGLALMLRGSR
jgi:hypothetical protein